MKECKTCKKKNDHDLVCAICIETNGNMPSVNELGL